MSRTLFENSKAALAFAAVTLVGAVAMVGSSDNEGVLPRVAEGLAEQTGNAGEAAPAPAPTAEGAAQTSAPVENAQSETPVFGDYAPAPDSKAPQMIGPAHPSQVSPAPQAPGPGGLDPSMNAY